MPDDGAAAGVGRSSRLRAAKRSRLPRQVAVGLGTGVLAGMATFAWTRGSLLPAWYPQWVLLAAMAVAGGCTYLLTTSLRRSVRAMAVSFATAVAVDVAGWIGPLWLEPYSPGTRDILIQRYLQAALPDLIMTYFLVYMGGYLALLSVGGYMDW